VDIIERVDIKLRFTSDASMYFERILDVTLSVSHLPLIVTWIDIAASFGMLIPGSDLRAPSSIFSPNQDASKRTLLSVRKSS
jgi:hypothetical protein